MKGKVITVIALAVMVVFAYTASALAENRGCHRLAEKLDAVNQKIGSNTALNISTYDGYFLNPGLGQYMFARVTLYEDAAWSRQQGGTPRQFEFENGDIWWRAVTHKEIFIGADGSAYIVAWGPLGPYEKTVICTAP